MLLAVAAFLLAVQPAYADPDVDDHYPGKNADNIPLDCTIIIEFDEDMDQESLRKGITLRDGDGRNVTGKVTYDSGSREARFKPDSPLKYNTRYRVRLSSAIENEDGDNLDSYYFYFNTARDAEVYVDDVKIIDDTIIVNRSPVNITVDAPGSEKVVYNGDELESRRDEYYLPDVLLKPGSNSFTCTVVYEYEDEKGNDTEATFTVKKTINFVNTPGEGATATHDLKNSNKVSVFDKQLTIEFPKNYFFRQGLNADHSQQMAFKLEGVYNASGSPAVSYLFHIAHVPRQGDEYRYHIFADADPGVNAPAGARMTLPLENLNEAAFSTVTVLYDKYDGVHGNWENIGGQTDPKKKTITVPFKGFGRYVAVNRLWNFQERDMDNIMFVQYLWAKGIMSPLPGVLPGRFGLVDSNGGAVQVSRGEFAVMLAKALGLRAGDESRGIGLFSDVLLLNDYSFGYNTAGNLVPLARYDTLYIEALAKNGLISGRREQDGRFVFRYFDGLTREQAAVSIMAAAGLSVKLTGDRTTRTQLARQFKDQEKISTATGPYVLAAVQKGYLERYEDYTFRPAQTLTRAEAAAMIYKLMESKKLL